MVFLPRLMHSRVMRQTCAAPAQSGLRYPARAEVVSSVRRGSGAERPKPAREIKLPLTKAGDLDEGFGSGQHREQRQKEELLKRIRDLATLAWTRQVFEMI
jgi:hypothetical protein